MDFTWVTDALGAAAIVIQAIGILLIIYGCARAAWKILRLDLTGQKAFGEYENSKRLLIQRIILALDFFVAADLIRLYIASSQSDILSLALIVAIRIALNWSLSKEIGPRRS
ncbi:MAG: DUF1622 domain-containing protein [Candidatus Micrarchaeota archaeon]|nr:DUF1622 domain-containing protein [Candidatus Micrarchaeota archaeon]